MRRRARPEASSLVPAVLQVYNCVYAKAPERRRRSFWSRLWHHRARLVTAVLVANVLLGAAAYSALRAAGRLPSQQRERRETEVFDLWLRSVTFQRDIVTPLDDYLARNIVLPARLDSLTAAVRRSSQFDIPTLSLSMSPKEARSPVIRAWRLTIEQLAERGVRVYGSTRQLEEGRTWVRQYIQGRTSSRLRVGQVQLRRLLDRDTFLDRASAEVATRLQVTREEMNGIVAVAGHAAALREPDFAPGP